jgi:hypothetical protein
MEPDGRLLNGVALVLHGITKQPTIPAVVVDNENSFHAADSQGQSCTGSVLNRRH